MQNDDGNATGVAALLDIQPMPFPDIQHPLIERLDPRVEIL